MCTRSEIQTPFIGCFAPSVERIYVDAGLLGRLAEADFSSKLDGLNLELFVVNFFFAILTSIFT